MPEAEANGSEKSIWAEKRQNKSNKKSQRFARSGKMLTFVKLGILRSYMYANGFRRLYFDLRGTSELIVMRGPFRHGSTRKSSPMPAIIRQKPTKTEACPDKQGRLLRLPAARLS